MFQRSPSQVKYRYSAGSITRIFPLILIITALAIDLTARAQSARPGWGSTPYNDLSGTGVTFRVWAPNATSVTTPGSFNGWSTSATPLVNELSNGLPTGVWSADVPSATNGSQYKYYITYNGSSNYKHDPRSRWVVNAGGGSGNNDIIYDPTAFNWNGDNFTNPPLNDLFVYEIHMGTFPASTVPNRFVAATNKLDYLKNLGVNAVELMPIMEFGNGGNSWGYDPAQLFAVDNAQYGGPDALKTFVLACHARGIAVLLDVVHNHYGTGLLDMWNFDGWAQGTPTNSVGGGGIYFYQSNFNLQNTGWGATRPNVSSNQVANFIQDNIAMWLSECHVDGFRWDSVYTLTHGYDNSYIPTAGNLVNTINAMIHTNSPGKISIAEDVYNTWGFNSSWDTGYPYNFTPVLTNMVDANRNMVTVANDVQNNVSYPGTASLLRVAYLESHDVVGDLNGSTHVRLPTAIDPVTPNSYRARKLSTLGETITATAPGIPMIFQGQEMLENQQFNSGRNVDWSKTNTYNYIVRFYHDLIGARRNLQGLTPGLEGDRCTMLAVDNVNKLVAFNRWNSTNSSLSAVVVGNFTSNVLNNYSLTFPSAGNWYVQLNSDSTNYGPDYSNIGSSVVTANGNPATANITIGPYSALILSQVPPVPTVSITQSNNVLTVFWPTTPPGSVLESSSTLSGGSLAWSQVPASQYQTNGNTVSINVGSPADATFYRLYKP
jgi:1,4-alpha-glucan branching enzyme